MRISVTTNPDIGIPFILERLHAHEELGRPHTYDVYLLAKNRDVCLSELLGGVIVVSVEVGGGKERYFGGYVTKAAALGSYGTYERYRVELRPWLALLANRATCWIFQDTFTVWTALQAVVEEAGFKGSLDVKSHDLESKPQLLNLVQYRESDYNFFMRILEQEGWFFYTEQDAERQDLVVLARTDDHPSSGSPRTIPWRSPEDRAVVEDAIDGWSINEQVRTTHYQLDDYDYTKPNESKSNEPLLVASTDPKVLRGKKEKDHPDRAAMVYDYPGEYLTVDEGSQYTTIRQQEVRADRRVVTAHGGVRDLSAGDWIKLKDHPRGDQNDTFVVTAMDLTIEAAGAESGHGASGDFVFRGRYTLLDSNLPFRLQRITPKPLITGPQTATVVGPESEEIHTDEFGRVRVKFRWDRTEWVADQKPVKEEERSCWIRVAQPWASSGFGFQFIPRIGDEVVVQFLEGDPDRPLITGSVYNATNKFPYAPNEHKTQSGVKTRSSKGGGAQNANEIRFEDLKGKEDFFVQAERNHTVKVKANRSVSVGGSESYSVSGTRDTTITKKNTDKYKDEHEMTVTKKVVEIFNDEHWLHVQKKQTIEIITDKEEHIIGNFDLTTDLKYLLKQGPASVKLEAGAVTIESPIGIVLKCGASTIEITPAGVSVKGPMVLINS